MIDTTRIGFIARYEDGTYSTGSRDRVIEPIEAKVYHSKERAYSCALGYAKVKEVIEVEITI